MDSNGCHVFEESFRRQVCGFRRSSSRERVTLDARFLLKFSSSGHFTRKKGKGKKETATRHARRNTPRIRRELLARGGRGEPPSTLDSLVVWVRGWVHKNVRIPADYRQSLRHDHSIVICGAPRRASSPPPLPSSSPSPSPSPSPSRITIERAARKLGATPCEDAGEGRRGSTATRELEAAGCHQVLALQRLALPRLAKVQGQQLRRGGGFAG